MKEEKYEINFTDGAFGSEGQRSNLHGRKQFTQEVARAEKLVESLDSQDDFRKLMIDRTAYKKSAKHKYGINYDRTIHAIDGSVILTHQERAAEKFLRDLRGFGLLADVVGSGKTFEAGVILSELAVRGKVKSLLVVAPDQVFDNWVNVLENKFGLGRDLLLQVRKQVDKNGNLIHDYPALDEVLGEAGVTREGGFIRPKRPIIVDVDIFSQWRYPENFLVDVIVVDEAHHLSEEAGKYAGAMRLLSEMMQTKKKAEATYCLLLTATPHSGNLENMFRLWYFVRCKGGNPSDFDEKDDKDRTKQYREEKNYYKEYICRGASNVTEFIRRVKYLEVTGNYSLEFSRYLIENGIEEEFAAKSEYDKCMIADAFLNERGNEDISQAVEKSVANAYHNGVLRSIMIRQPNKLSKSKKIFNYFFYPLSVPVNEVEITGLESEKIRVDFTDLSPRKFPKVHSKGGAAYLDEYVEHARGNLKFEQAYSDLINHILSAFNDADPKSGEIFNKSGYVSYYADRLASCPAGIAANTCVLPVRYSSDKLGYKYECAKSILRRHEGLRVLVFFDYELPKSERAYDEFCDALLADPEFKDRVIVGDAASAVRDIERRFNSREDAILVVKDAKFTEGANLQESNIIINYQVTPDPLAMDQRIGRIFRLGQKSEVFVYSLADMNALEGFALSYFSAIGLLSSNSGDATILAGSNSDQMVALRCRQCSRVKLMTRADYEEKKRNRSHDLICDATDACRGLSIDGKGMEMSEITVYDFKCDSCGTVLTRSVSEGYTCIAHVADGEKGRMCNSGEKGDRSVYCRKICAVSHCKRFLTDKRLKGKCNALIQYNAKPNISEAELMKICALCDNAACWDSCKISGTGKDQISNCGDCEYAGCSPAPHSLDFDDKWEAYCPMPSCRNKRPRGKLRPIVARTFATFINELWKFSHDGGESFCRTIGKEADKVSEVRRILEQDAGKEER